MQSQILRSGLYLVLVALMGLALEFDSAEAQQWEWVYGATNFVERGHLRVAPVTRMPSNLTWANGYISVGTDGGLVYVVRTDNNGASVWEKGYAINMNGNTLQGYREANSIIELVDSTGFVIVGSIQQNLQPNPSTNFDILLLKIDHSGNLVWSQTYGGPDDEWGMDVIEAKTGDPLFGTLPGDIVVCGATKSTAPGPTGNPGIDAYLFRTTSAGTLLWDAAYDQAPLGLPSDHFDEMFWSLTELTPMPIVPPHPAPTTTGDIVAVGGATTFGPADGYVVRVDGNTGLMGPVYPGVQLQNAATYGRPTEDDVFYSVIELENPGELGTLGRPNVVIAGMGEDSTNFGASGQTSNNYLVKLDDGDPCAPLVETFVGNATQHDAGRTIREITFSFPSGNATRSNYQWDLALVGTVGARVVPALTDDAVPGPTAQGDIFLLTVDPFTLLPPAGGISNTFGSTTSDVGWSVFPVDSKMGRDFGFIMCGTTYDRGGDPGDMYLLKTDSAGETGCEDTYSTDDSTVTLMTCVVPTVAVVGLQAQPSTLGGDRDLGTEICGALPKPTPANSESELDLSSLSSGIHAFPNPVTAGSPLRLKLEREGSENVDIEVFDALGKSVSTSVVPSSSEIIFPTTELLAGFYHIVVKVDERQYRVRLIIVD